MPGLRSLAAPPFLAKFSESYSCAVCRFFRLPLRVLAEAAVLSTSVAARVCREAGGRVTVNVAVRGVRDRVEEVVADGLPLFSRGQGSN